MEKGSIFLFRVNYFSGPWCAEKQTDSYKMFVPFCKMIESLPGTICEMPGPSCSKLTTSLVSDSLKFTSSDTQIC